MALLRSVDRAGRSDRLDLGRGESAFAAEHITQSIQHHLTAYQGVLGEHQPQQIRAKTSGQKGTHQHIGVEENPHADPELLTVQDTAEKTSSSVSQPASSPK